MNNKNKSILIISNDELIIDIVKKMFVSYNIVLYNKNINYNNFNLILLDDIKLTKTELNTILQSDNIINISGSLYDNCINIQRPFQLDNLIDKIKYLLEDINILYFNNFKIINNTLKYNNTIINLGSTEIALFKYLYHNNEASKTELLKEIWGYNENSDTKVLENTINKLRQKLKDNQLDNIIINENKLKLAPIIYSE